MRMSKRNDMEARRKPDARRGYQVKGAHEKSYLDLSQLKFSLRTKDDSDSDESDSSRDTEDVQFSSSQLAVGPSVIRFDSGNISSSSSDYSLQSRSDTLGRTGFKPSGKFVKSTEPPKIFQGRYLMQSISDFEETKKNYELSVASTKETMLPTSKTSVKAEARHRYVMETRNIKGANKIRGYYSETISPFLRPERILAQRQKEMEELKRYAIEGLEDEEEEGEEKEIRKSILGETDEQSEEEESKQLEKDLLKDWPPIYKVLNPDHVLAEFDLPVTYKEPSLVSKGRMPKYAIHLESVPAVSITRNFLQPEEKWVVYESEPNVAFPVKAFRPRCFILHVVEPGTLPRKVYVERKRRQYLSQNIEELLAQHGLTDDDLLPPATSKSEDQYSLYGSASFLPLEVFDDEEFDPCSVADWLELGKIGGVQHPIPAVGFIPISNSRLPTIHVGRSSLRYTNKRSRKLLNMAKQKKMRSALEGVHYLWMDVAVTNYNYKQKTWSILTLDGNQTRLQLPRIYVMFRAEDPLNFTYRVMDAVVRRRHTEKLIKFNIYCDCMPLTGIDDLNSESMNRIYKSVTRNGYLKGVEETLALLGNDVQNEHKRNMAAISFRHMIDIYPDMFSFIELPLPEPRKVPDKSMADTDMEDFKGTREKFSWWWLYVIDETYLGMMHVVTACLKVYSMNFFTANYGKSISLEEFDSIQTNCTNNLIKYLRKDWVDNVVTNVRMCLQDVGKGWFNIKEKSWPIYELSKLCRFMDLIKFRMQTALKYLVDNSTDLFCKIIGTPSSVCLNVPDEGFVWGPELLETKFKPPSLPIFNLTLKMGPTGATYTTNPDIFEDVLLKLYDNAIMHSHTIPQIHPYLLLNLRFPQSFLSSTGLMDPNVTNKRNTLRMTIRKALIPLKAYANEYKQYLPLFNLDVNDYVAKFAAQNYSAHEIKDEVLKQMEARDALEGQIPSFIVIGPFLVATETIRHHLMDKRQMMCDHILNYFADRLKNQVIELLEEFDNLMVRMLERPTSIENVFEIKEWLDSVPATVKGYDEVIRRVITEYELLDSFTYSLENEDFENKYALIGWPYKLILQIEATHEMLAEETEKFYKLHQAEEAGLWEKYETCVAEVQSLMQVSDITKVHDTAVQVRKVWKMMKDSQEIAAVLAGRQKLFGMPPVNYDSLARLVKDFGPYKDLWLTASDWLRYCEIWMENPLSQIDGEGIERLHGDMYKTMQKCQRIFMDVPANYQIATAIKNDIDDFRPYIPLIVALKSPGLRDRHWDQILKQTGCNIKVNMALTFKDCLQAGLQYHAETLVKISETATKEHAIEVTMEEMEKDWEAIELELHPYKETGTYILRLPDEVLQMLEDHIVTTQQFSFSPFKGMFEQRIDDWEAKLRLISAVLDEWSEVQKQWMYLEPIFTSEDITQQLPHESKKYNTVERTWRRVMKTALEMPKARAMPEIQRLLESLKECNFLLEQVQKGLAEYLEAKRTVFPRLYFLSDDELLEILAQAKNPLAVQPHLRKCFENIYKLNFESDLKITKMYSGEGECVPLIEPMYPKGSVEYWLYLVEEAMKTTVRLTLGKSLVNMAQVDRNKWVLNWPGQIVIAGCQTYWTAHVEEALIGNSLGQYYQLMLTQLDGLRALVRGPLKRVERQILSALIVIEVHARDVTQQMYDNNVKNVNDFDWISQLRYYWEKETDLKVRAVNAEFQYGYEYLGNSGRLVITPLTDRCYLTLTGALHLKFGGAPAGPAGTGKTETTKDLAKAFAIQCVVFNCSDQLDFMAMGKFFKGLASSGAWACFDEFNRIDIEVLSVIAQQVVTIQKAQIQRLDRFMFEGVEIGLKPSCAVFITMNPGYAGRTELPDNLKALFRPVAMMVPNYTLIAEISLFSFGFSDAKELAGKITTTFKLSSEQLSSQDHYDFGMRAVKTVIAVAGNLKREQPQMDERQIVLRALRDVNVPKFLKDDLKLFNGIISDLFPRMVEEVVDYGALEESIRYCTKNFILEDVDEQEPPSSIKLIHLRIFECQKLLSISLSPLYLYRKSQARNAVEGRSKP
ncbi:hypothetical protein RUM43_006450 [Polyplax serrata]|uniref:Dynein heavy chain 1, axonemal n=1 Tax=Polyplax serrata TaxID=468196 RepID=A0AAN8PLD9_POLSC